MGQQGEGGGELFELPTSVRKLLGAFVGGTLLPGVPVITMFPGEVDFPKWKRFSHSLAMSESPHASRPLPGMGVLRCSTQPWAALLHSISSLMGASKKQFFFSC